MNSQSLELKENQTQRINQIIANFAKTDPSLLKYSEVLMLMLDRCVFSNKFTLGNFHQLFIQVYTKSKDPKTLQDQKIINKDQLILLLNEMAKVLFKPDSKYLQKFYNTFLSEKSEVQNGEINHSRVMVFDGLNAKLITEESIKKIAEYEQELKHIFIAYLFENYWSLKKSKRVLLTLREIILQNKKWSFLSLIHFCKDSETTPHFVTIQHIEETMKLIIPSINNKQQEFYSRHIISDSYHKESENNETASHLGDPGIIFFEFELLIARIALDSHSEQLEKKASHSMGDILQRYFNYLLLRKNEQLATKPIPNINRKMITVMKEYYRISDSENNKNEKKEQLFDEISGFQRLAQKMQNEITNAPEITIDFNDCYKNLDKQLPKLPPLPVVEPEYLPPYKKQIAVTIGKQPPPEPAEPNDKIKVEKKKEGGKKDQIPPRVFKWAEIPKTKLASEDYLKEISSKLNFQVGPLSSLERGAIKRQVYPILIGETLCPPEMPKSVAPYLTAAMNAMVEGNYILAIENFNNGASAWKKTLVEFQPTVELFFQYSKGSIYLRAGKNDYAFQEFYSCRKFADPNKIPFINPDRSLPYFGLGEVFYELEEYELSARAFLKARQIRESVLGIQHVQTATVFNNLACCYYMLGRKQQALGYIEIAEVVLDMQLGEHHERTMTARFNLNLVSHGTIDNKPEFRKFWEVFEEDKFEKKKKKKEKDAKKK